MFRNLFPPLLRLFTRKPTASAPEKILLSDKEKISDLGKREQKLFRSLLKFQNTLVREVMVPRIHMDCIKINASLPQILDLVIEKGHTRLPVYENRIDNIIGILNVKDLIGIWRHRKLIILHDLLRPVYFVPETKKIRELLQELQRQRMHIAIVVDEYGGTAGLVTIEDLIEEIVGEIRDEYDHEEELIQYQPDGSLIIRADYGIQEANEKFGLHIPENDFESLGGFIIHYLGRLPGPGERVYFQNLMITVLEADIRRIRKLKIKKINDQGEKNHS